MGVKRDRDSAGMSNDMDTISEDEAALYDRQIRLWGLDCQKRLREARVLVIGLNGLGAEVVKNLTLSGVKSITIMDEKVVSEADSTAQFFVVGNGPGLSRAQASKAAIQELNPNVKIEIVTEPVSSKSSEFFADFSAVFVTDCLLSVLIQINNMCHEKNVHFYSGDTWGSYGYGFLDLQQHTYSKTIPKTKTEKEKSILETLDYCPIGPALGAKVGCGLNNRVNKVYVLLNIMNNFQDTHQRYPLPTSRGDDLANLESVRSSTVQKLVCDESKVNDEMLQNVFGELSPVCAAVGGIIANEMIKGISRKGEPIFNFLLFDGEDCNAVVETIIKD